MDTDTGTREEDKIAGDELDKYDSDKGDDDAKADDNENDEGDEDGVPQTSGGVIKVCSRLMYVFSSDDSNVCESHPVRVTTERRSDTWSLHGKPAENRNLKNCFDIQV